MEQGEQNRFALLTAISSDLESYNPDTGLWLDSEAGLGDAASSLLRSTLCKKWEATTERADSRALLTFLEANYLAGKWELSPTLAQDMRWGEFRREIDDFFHDGPEPIVSSFSELFRRGGVGPGSAIGADCTSFYGKFSGAPLSVGSLGLYLSYRCDVSKDQRWQELEQLRSAGRDTARIVDGSTVSFAPKNVDTARLICVEPLLNMWYQLGLKAVLDDRMRSRWNVDMEVQPELNRLLAKQGSRGGGFATIDLSSASDLISVNLCRAVLPQWLFELLWLLRSDRTNVKAYGLKPELNMMSTMGNGFTFPLMTILLSCAIRAVYRCKGVRITDNPRTKMLGYNVPGNWGAFGDDLIVLDELYDEVVEFLHLLGFQVNVTKSFNQGPFRESCGHDYYRGVNIRGVYLKRLTSRQDLTIAVNRLNDWTYRTGIPLTKSVTLLMSLIDRKYMVPYQDPEDAGIRVPSSLISQALRRNANGLVVYQGMVARPAKVKIGDGVVKTPRGSKRMRFNSAAVLLSLLLGELRNGQISVRQNSSGNMYQTRRRVVPWWDFMPASEWVNPRLDWQRWETAVWLNLIESDLKA